MMAVFKNYIMDKVKNSRKRNEAYAQYNLPAKNPPHIVTL